MKSKEYIKNKLQELKDTFFNISFRYQFEENTQTHIVEVLPLEYYDKNLNYIKAEARLIIDFEKTFDSESILFVSEDSLTKVVNPEFVLDSFVFTLNPLKDYHYSTDIAKNDFEINDSLYALAA
jgi:hypothetical protein